MRSIDKSIVIVRKFDIENLMNLHALDRSPDSAKKTTFLELHVIPKKIAIELDNNELEEQHLVYGL